MAAPSPFLYPSPLFAPSLPSSLSLASLSSLSLTAAASAADDSSSESKLELLPDSSPDSLSISPFSPGRLFFDGVDLSDDADDIHFSCSDLDSSGSEYVPTPPLGPIREGASEWTENSFAPDVVLTHIGHPIIHMAPIDVNVRQFVDTIQWSSIATTSEPPSLPMPQQPSPLPPRPRRPMPYNYKRPSPQQQPPPESPLRSPMPPTPTPTMATRHRGQRSRDRSLSPPRMGGVQYRRTVSGGLQYESPPRMTVAPSPSVRTQPQAARTLSYVFH